MAEKNFHFKKNDFYQFVFIFLGLTCLLLTLTVLISLLLDLAIRGGQRIDWDFLTSFPSRFPAKAGILSAWVGSALVMLTTAFLSIPLGVAAAIYLEEYAAKNWLTTFIELNISNLAGVPSITFGLMALGLFVHRWDLGSSILTAGMTLTLLILPIIIVATREAIRAIPQTIREAAMGLGASKWQMVADHLLPYSMGGILTGVIIAMSRAIGETAPLITIGALTYIAFLPPDPLQPENSVFAWLHSPFTVLPIQMFNWVSRPQVEFHVNAAATGLILLMMTLLMNGVAVWIRFRFRKKIRW